MPRVSLRCVTVFIAGLCMVGCREQNRNYCGDAPHTNCMDLDAALQLCTSDQQCAPNVCDLSGSRACVQCTSSNPAACTATTPVCGTDNMCRSCTSHAECSSNVCLPDGSCALEPSVAYIAENGSGSTCGKLTPCQTLAAGLQTNRPYVKFAAGLIKDTQATTVDSKTVMILADAGAKLDRDGDGPILMVQSSGAAGANVQIFDLEITGATGAPGGDAIRLTANGGSPVLGLTRVTIDKNQGIGVTSAGGSLTISQSTFNGNDGGAIAAANGSLTVSRSKFNGNQGGGISEMNGTFVVVGNVFYGNGGLNSSVGGIAITTMPNGMNRLEFNSFALNTTQTGIGPAIQCFVSMFKARNNIMSDNRTSAAQADQFAGSCTHTFSIMRPGSVPTGDSGSDPLFVDPSKGDLHIATASPARGSADPGSDLTGIASHDIDGVARVSPADIGAYEFKASAISASSRSGTDGMQR